MLDCSIWYSCCASMQCCSSSTLRPSRAHRSNDTWEYSARSWSCWLACVSNAFPPPPALPSLPRFPPISSKYTSPSSPMTTKSTILTGFSFSGATQILMYAVLIQSTNSYGMNLPASSDKAIHRSGFTRTFVTLAEKCTHILGTTCCRRKFSTTPLFWW